MATEQIYSMIFSRGRAGSSEREFDDIWTSDLRHLRTAMRLVGIVASAAIILAGLTTGGAKASSLRTAVEDSHPQTQVAVAGQRRLNLFCLGQGEPTVLLEAGSGGSTADWWQVQARLAAVTRTCAYDRAGYGYSDPPPAASSAEAAVDDLHHLIEAAHLGPHPVIVGHSNGGLYAMLYAERYSAALGGLVLVDPGFPGQQDYDRYGLTPVDALALHGWTRHLIADARMCLRAAQNGTIRTDPARAGCLATPSDDPAVLRAALRRIYTEAVYEAANLSEFENSFGADAEGLTADDRAFPTPLRPLDDLPLIVLTADHHPVPVSGFVPVEQEQFWTIWKEGHDRLARLSRAGISRVVVGSGHFIQIDKPDAVLAAVTQVVTAVRNEKHQ